MKIAVAGASGFIGKRVVERLAAGGHQVIGLARSAGQTSSAGVIWRQCDLYSLLDIDRGLEGAEVAIYLVHSMRPSGRLSQGSFRDYDLILADNFARAAHRHGLGHIVYLGGILPLSSTQLSEHLRSRLEVEETLAHYGIPLTALRAGLIVGAEGSSFTILRRLVERLPVMLCPAWTRTKTQPVHVDDVVDCIAETCIAVPSGKAVYDLGGPDILTYQSMLEMTAKHLGKRRCFLPINVLTPGLSRLWVSAVTGAPRALLRPLIHSLQQPMVASPKCHLLPSKRPPIPLAKALEEELTRRPESGSEMLPHAFRRAPRQRQRPSVQSVQRLTLPRGKSAAWVAQKYMEWLPKFFRRLLKVSVRGDECHFRLVLCSQPLLVLERSSARSTVDRQLFYIRGGMLAVEGSRGRLEFRQTGNGRTIIAAIHDYWPRLPWYLYRLTQAKAHLATMRAFERYLRRVDKRIERSWTG